MSAAVRQYRHRSQRSPYESGSASIGGSRSSGSGSRTAAGGGISAVRRERALAQAAEAEQHLPRMAGGDGAGAGSGGSRAGSLLKPSQHPQVPVDQVHRPSAAPAGSRGASSSRRQLAAAAADAGASDSTALQLQERERAQEKRGSAHRIAPPAGPPPNREVYEAIRNGKVPLVAAGTDESVCGAGSVSTTTAATIAAATATATMTGSGQSRGGGVSAGTGKRRSHQQHQQPRSRHPSVTEDDGRFPHLATTGGTNGSSDMSSSFQSTTSSMATPSSVNPSVLSASVRASVGGNQTLHPSPITNMRHPHAPAQQPQPQQQLARGSDLQSSPQLESSDSKPVLRPQQPQTSTSKASKRAAVAAAAAASGSVRAPLSNAPARALVGLANLGNTCFMNSCLQCLMHVEPLVDFFITGQYTSHLRGDSPMRGQLAKEFGSLAKAMHSNNASSSISPAPLKRVVSKWAPHFSGMDQQDCQEFLRFLLDGLSEDLRQPYPEPSLPRRSRPAARNGLRRRDGAEGGSPSSSSSSSLAETARSKTSGLKQRLYGTILRGQKSSGRGQGDGEDREEQQEEEAAEAAGDGEHAGQVAAEQSPSSEDEDDGEAAGPETESEEVDVDSLPPHEQASFAWDKHMAKNASVIQDLFGGQLQSTVECMTCHHRSYCFDPFLDLSVPIPKSAEVRERSSSMRLSARGGGGGGGGARQCSLTDCLRCFASEEVLERDNAVTCDQCKKKRKSVKRLMVYQFPEILVIHIKRFSYTSFFREKLSTNIDFPLQSLDVAPYLSPEAQQAHRAQGRSLMYDLIGVSNHMGGMGGGHYTAAVDASFGGGKWHLFNDARVSATSTNQLSGPSVYVLFYKRRGDRAGE